MRDVDSYLKISTYYINITICEFYNECSKGDACDALTEV